jgi:hypothetical protein
VVDQRLILGICDVLVLFAGKRFREEVLPLGRGDLLAKREIVARGRGLKPSPQCGSFPDKT